MKSLFLISIYFFSITTFANTSIWKIEKNNKTIYVGGTIHLLKESDYPLPTQYDSIYKLCNEVIFEADTRELETPAGMQALIKKIQLPDNIKLKTILSDTAYSLLKNEIEKAGMKISRFESFKPSFVILTLTMMQLQSIGVSATGVDKYYMNKGLKDEKKISFLESGASQIDIIASMGDGHENEMIFSSIQEMELMKTDFEKMTLEWKNGSGQTIAKQMEEMKVEYPALYADLLLNRNTAWLSIIQKELDDLETEFILVGTGHLVGPDSILKLLENKGYTITQL